MPVILGGNTGIYLASLTPPAPSFVGLLDTYPNAAVAYSLRKLRSAYTGSAIRVRRSSDNAEQDIAFVGNDLDTTTMLDFVGYNMWTYSEDISQAVYPKNNLNTTGTPAYIDVETAPDSTLTGDKLIENTGNALHSIGRASGTIVNGVSYNVSVYLKQGERTKVEIASNISNSTQTCQLDLTNGSVSNSTFANTPVVTAESNGWYRFSVTITSGTTSATGAISIRLMNASNATTYTGNGTSGAYVWGFQLSQTSTVKTYQKTVATAGGNGFVTTWYDQSTNANNSTQATAASQAQVVLNSNLILDPITNKISTLWSGDAYLIGSSLPTPQLNYQLAVFNRTASAQGIISLGSNVTSAYLGYWQTNNVLSTFYGTTAVNHLTSTSTGIFIQSVLRDSSNVVKCWNNQTALTTGTDSTTSRVFTYWGKYNIPQSSGYKQELVYWTSDQEANRTGIETNVNTYWNAY
jgi:hypothetical protein